MRVVLVVPLIVPAQAHGRSVRVHVMAMEVFDVVMGSMLPPLAHTSVLMHSVPLGERAHVTAAWVQDSRVQSNHRIYLLLTHDIQTPNE